jgi:hypothetical protein
MEQLVGLLIEFMGWNFNLMRVSSLTFFHSRNLCYFLTCSFVNVVSYKRKLLIPSAFFVTVQIAIPKPHSMQSLRGLKLNVPLFLTLA